MTAIFTVAEAISDSDRNRYASKAYGKFSRHKKYKNIKRWAFGKASEAWQRAHG